MTIGSWINSRGYTKESHFPGVGIKGQLKNNIPEVVKS